MEQKGVLCASMHKMHVMEQKDMGSKESTLHVGEKAGFLVFLLGICDL